MFFSIAESIQTPSVSERPGQYSPRVRLSFRAVNRSQLPAEDPGNESSLSSLSSRPPPSQEDDSAEDEDYVPDQGVTEDNTGEGAADVGEDEGVVSESAVKCPVSVSCAERPAIKLMVFSAPGISEASVPQRDHLFIPKDPGFGAIGLGGSLLPNFKPSALASVEGFLASKHCVQEVGMCVCCLKHLRSNKQQACVQINNQRKCSYCARLGNDCQFIPHHYQAAAQLLEAGPQNKTF